MSGQPITMSGGKLQVPSRPIIPYIEGDGTGPDIWRASVRIVDAEVARSFGVDRPIEVEEVPAGEKGVNQTGH